MTRAELRAKVLRDLGEDESSPVYYSAGEVHTALDEAARAMSFLTLCCELRNTMAVSGVFTSTDGLPRFILPLRVLRDGVRVWASSLNELAALGADWRSATSGQLRYAFLGSNQLVTRPASGSLDVVYAASAAPMASDGASPDIPETHHLALVDYAVARLRMKEGSQEFQRAAERLDAFQVAAVDLAAKVAQRARELGYDREPIEFQRVDISRLLRKKEKPRASQPD